MISRMSWTQFLRAICCALASHAILAAPLRAQATTAPAEEKQQGLFTGSDGAFDISNFLSTRTGFLPLAVPITEPAVGYGLGIGLTFFHEKPPVVQGPAGQTRTILPSTTVLVGATTENETWAAGVGHLHVWDAGRIRYLGAAGFASLNLDWFGRSDALNGRSISYTNEVFFVQQQVTFQLGESNFYIGPYHRFFSTDSAFAFTTLDSGISDRDLDSNTSGLGIELIYDSRDQPFSPNRGNRASLGYSQQAEWLGGDYNYGKLLAYWITYVPLRDNLVLALHADGAFNIGDAPYYDLPMIMTRGIPIGRFMDNNAVLAEAELRWDLTRRWSLIGFGGVGRVGDSLDDLLDADNQPAAGAGFRYLIAEEYGLRMGVDVAYGDDDWAIYIGAGTGWLRL
jgi:hypothetical protein